MIGKGTGAKDWASTIAIVFVLALVGLIFANQYVADFPIGTTTFIFIGILGIGLFIGVRLLGLSTSQKQLQFEDLAIMGAVGFALYWVLTNYDLAPSFSVALSSVLGLG